MYEFNVLYHPTCTILGIDAFANLTRKEGIKVTLICDKGANVNSYTIKSRDSILTESFSCELSALDYLSGWSKNFQPQENIEIWAEILTNCSKDETLMAALDKYLSLKTFLSGHSMSCIDIAMFSILKPDPPYPNVTRWHRFIAHLIGPTISTNDKFGNQGNVRKAQVDNSYRGKLKNAVEGQVVTRFPPEPSGYLHIGHAKAALLNHYYAQEYGGKFILRFDDTNPVKESTEFQESITKDLELLGVKPNFITYSSDYFEKLQGYAIQLIKSGFAYCDDTSVDAMRNQRNEGTESVRRNESVETNLKHFKEMLDGTTAGETFCLRAKIDMKSKNKCMRDPVLYRCVIKVPHHRFGTKYKAYPTYDFACPVIDSIEGVTHALRTNEYSDRIAQYNWVIEALKLRPVEIYEFSRLNFVRTVLSKSKLNWFVTNKLVDGWEDPRMPTIRGILKRGLTVQALLEFVLDQGPSKAGNCMEWDKLWAKNKQILDRIVPRYSAVELPAVKVEFNTSKFCEKMRALHQKNPKLGECKQYLTPTILLDKSDISNDPEEVTLMRWGNAFLLSNDNKKNTNNDIILSEIEGRLNLDGDFKATKKKLHWVPYLPDKLCKLILREYGYLLKVNKLSEEAANSIDVFKNEIETVSMWEKEALGEPEMACLKIGDKIQLERKGYYTVLDKLGDKIILSKIPDGKQAK
ncbi:glutamyl-tRNA synthetase [Babesia microti strain RI]|uniref:glutamate--tRNA ligase n=1 Tax=Babesia microti (strain RI) TaxID=1133968 RepID=A0A1N6LX95_BABMR|nr:glutamyl-tRNA synthetase [Babesia microti strain RI]SIO73498.1 glutamyl-tRNA synthetase [Babesia microti strain RI]|eukprot:XP_021337593.1 glutamyl-tRNA synthetase [Babesia microti strain RI]